MPEWDAEKNWLRISWFAAGALVCALLNVAYRVGKDIKWSW